MVLAVALTALPQLGRADVFDRLPEGAPIYASLRPVAFVGALRRLGLNELPEVQKLKQQLGGIDPLDPALLAPVGIDVASPAAASLFEEIPKTRRYHHRLVVTIRDKMLFVAFIAGVAASSQLPLQLPPADSPLAKAGVVVTATLPDGSSVIARVQGDLAIFDSIGAWEGKGPPPLEVLKKYPLDVKTPFQPGRGARRMFSPDAALVLYTDGRKLATLLEAVQGAPAKGEAKGGKKGGAASCRAQWDAAPSSFDDVALALAVDPDGLKLSLAWGSQAGVPLGGLKFAPVDDRALDVGLLSRTAPAVLAIYAAGLAPFQSLKRGGVLESFSTLSGSVMRCGAPAWGHLLVRSWPQALGAMLSANSGKQGVDPSVAMMLATFGQLRNVVLALRDATPSSVRWALGSTFDVGARPMLELLLGASSGGQSSVMPIGQHSPTVYHLTVDGNTAASALETLGAGPVSLVVTDSDDSLTWAYRTATALPGAAPAPSPGGALPVLSLSLDGIALGKLVPLLKIGQGQQALIDLMARLKRVDADLTADGDLFRLTMRSPIKQ